MRHFRTAGCFLRGLALGALIAIGTAAAAFEPALPGERALGTYDNASSEALASALTSGTPKTYAAGALIIPMDIDYQDSGAFQAYGLVYKLLANGIPVDWVIAANKRVSTIATSPNGATESGNTATFTTTGPHELSVGQVVRVAGVGVLGYNGEWTVASVLSATQFTAILGVSGLAVSGGGTVTPRDFAASFSDFRSGSTGTHAYRGGPFVVDQAHRAAADPIVQSWQTTRPAVNVHIATSSFTGNVARSLVAAPRIGVFNDGNTAIAFSYLNSAAIPDSQGNAWLLSSVDVVSVAAVAGPTTTTHRDGALFDANGVPVFSLLFSPHYNMTSVNMEVIAEAGEFLKSRTLLIAQCQAVHSFEDNGHFITDQGMTTQPQPASVDQYFIDQPLAQDDGLFGTIGGSDPSFIPTNVYNGVEGIDYFRIIRGQLSPNSVVVLGNAFQNAAGGRVMYLGGHQYSVSIPLSAYPASHGVRYFLNALLFAPSTAAGDGIGDLSLTLNGPASSVNASLDYTIAYRNSGAGVSLGTQISVPIPGGMTASMISGSGVISGGQIVWNLGNIDAGQPTPAGTLSFRLTASGYGNFEVNAIGSYKRGITPASIGSSINTSYAAATAPGAPIIGTATPLNGQASIAFTPPSSDGGSAIAGYSATCNPGPFTASGTASPIVVTGLTNGTTYSCAVTATNAVGTGAASGTVSVTPTTTSPLHSDFNGDARSDVFWRDTTGGLNYQWQMNGLALSGQGYMPSVPSNWMVAGIGDVNGGGIADVLWREAGGLNYLWLMNGLTVASQGYLPMVANPWIVVGLGDASGDGKADVFWRNPTTGQNYLWIMNGLAIASQGYMPSVAGPDWEAVGVADYSGDGKADVFWRNKTTGQNYLWVMNGLVVASQGYLPTITPVDWEVVGSPDASGDGKADVLWRHKITGQNYLWVMNGLAISNEGYLPSVNDANWKVVGFGDYNGDGKGDVLWRHATSGENYLWTLNGINVATQGYLPGVAGANWQPAK